MAFDPNQPFTIVEEEVAFDPTKPFSIVSEEAPVIEESSGVLRQAADIPLKFAQGGISSVKSFTDLFGADNAVSKELAGYEKWVGSLVSAESKKDDEEIARILKDAQDKGVYDKVIAGLQAFAKAPLEMTAQSVGYMVPQLAAGALGKAAKFTKAGIIGTQAALGFAQGVGQAKGDIYQATLEHLREQGVFEDKANSIAVEAQSTLGKNLDQILLSGGLNALASTTGAEAIATRILTKQGKEATGGAIKGLLKGVAAESPLEAIQSAQQEVAKNVALQREGVDVPTFKGAIESATTGAVAGAFIGGPLGAFEAMSPEQKAEVEITKEANRKARDLEAPDTASQAIAAGITNLERGIDNKRKDLDLLESTSPEATKLRLDISADQKLLAQAKEQANKLGLSETITEAEKQQIELAKQIAAPEVAVPVTPVSAPVTPTEVAVAEAATPVVEGLQAVSENTATPEQLTQLSESGLVDIVQGEPVINEEGQSVLEEAQAPLPKLTPEERRAEIEAAPTAESLVPSAALENIKQNPDLYEAVRKDAVSGYLVPAYISNSVSSRNLPKGFSQSLIAKVKKQVGDNPSISAIEDAIETQVEKTAYSKEKKKSDEIKLQAALQRTGETYELDTAIQDYKNKQIELELAQKSMLITPALRQMERVGAKNNLEKAKQKLIDIAATPTPVAETPTVAPAPEVAPAIEEQVISIVPPETLAEIDKIPNLSKYVRKNIPLQSLKAAYLNARKKTSKITNDEIKQVMDDGRIQTPLQIENTLLSLLEEKKGTTKRKELYQSEKNAITEIIRNYTYNSFSEDKLRQELSKMRKERANLNKMFEFAKKKGNTATAAEAMRKMQPLDDSIKRFNDARKEIDAIYATPAVSETITPAASLLSELGEGWKLDGTIVSKDGFGHWTEKQRDEARAVFNEAGILTNTSTPSGSGNRKSSFTIPSEDARRIQDEIFAEDVKLRKAKNEQAKADEEAKQAEKLSRVDPAAKRWMDLLFGRDDFANPANKVHLSDFVTGKTTKFGGMVNPRWFDGVQAAGAVLEGSKVDFQKLKENFENSVTKTTPAVSETITPAAEPAGIAPVVESVPANRQAEYGAAAAKSPWANDLQNKPTGWKIVKYPDGATLVSIDGSKIVRFESQDKHSGAEALRKKEEAQTWAIDNPLSLGESTTPASAKAATSKLRGEAGGVLIPSREDFIQAGQNIYEKGMEFGAWAKQMIQQFGDVVREFLGDVWQAVSGAPAKLNELMGYLPGKGEVGAVNIGQSEQAPIEPEAETITEAMAQGLDIGKEDNMPINNKIESHIKNFAVVRGFFESASDRLRRAGFKKLATAIDDYYDQAQRRLGFANKILLPAFDEYAKQSKANKKKIDEEIKMFYAAQENKRDTDEFFDELNPITQKIVTAWQKFGEESGKDNQRIGIKVFDRGLQRYRPIGRVEKFFPRILKPEYKRALMEPDKYQKEYNEIVDALIKSGRIEKPEEAERYISNYEGTGTQQDYFSGIESARGQALPEELYDYSMQVMTDYVARWSQHASRIEQFGQKLGENSMTLWDRSRASTRDRRTIDYITAAQERVEGYFPNDPIVKGMAAMNIWATGLQLGNPASAALNFVGGTTLNAMIGQPGAASSYVESLIELRKLGSNLQDAREKGIISRDLMNIVGDHQEVLDQNGIAKVGQKTADFLLKWSGFTPVEQMIRTQSLIIGKSCLRKTLSSFAQNPNSSFSRQASTWLSRNNFDIDKLLVEQGSGPETDRLMRYFANISQGGYTISQNPIFIDTPIGKFLFKYQKFSTQVMRQAWKNTFEPAWKAVTFKGETMQLPSETRQLLYRLRLAEAKEIGDNRKISLDEIPQKVSKAEARALTIIPVMMWLASAYVGGEAILRLRDVLFGVMMKGPDYEDILKALEDDEDDDELYLGLQRAWYNLIGIGALGLIGNYGQFFMDWQDRERVKNPLDPPALSLLKETGTLITNVADQGTLTKGDINNYLNRMSSMYRVSQKLYQTSASGLGFSDAPTVAEEMYRREVADINKYARRWAESAGLEYRTKRPMDIAPSKMTPINREISSYLQRNDPVTAAAYAKEYLKTLPKADRKSAIQSMESGARNRQPLRLGSGPMDEAEKRAFLKWAKTKMSPEKYAGIEKLAKQYESNRKKFLMRLPNR